MSVKVHNYASGVRPTSANAVFDLPVGVYTVKRDPDGVFFLQETSVPQDPVKVYGQDTNSRASRYLDFFVDHHGKTLGSLLIGEPGSGKTLLMRKIINMALSRDIHVILVESGFHGSNFNSFIHEQLRGISAVVAMDEFEKMYDMRDDEVLAPLLTLFDGPLTSHKFFVCTANNRDAVADPFFNRPSRIRYMAQFTSVSNEVIEEYLSDNLKFPELMSELMSVLVGMDKVNFDCLATATAEVNRTGSVTNAMVDLNIKDKYTSDDYYSIIKVVDRETGEEYLFEEDHHFKPEYEKLSFYVGNGSRPTNLPKKKSFCYRDLREEHQEDFDSIFNCHMAQIDFTKAPFREDGCFVFEANPRTTTMIGEEPENVPGVYVYVKSKSSQYAF
jgi:ATPase family associated with various cellular activities (AAA)